MWYFHNDIKLENLVLSGTTLKLIDFSSLMPVQQATDFKHNTEIYRHRHERAMGDTPEQIASSAMVWACGVVLTRFLAPELSNLSLSWVYSHRGLGDEETLRQALPEGHCLLDRSKDGPRDLLESIFSDVQTPSIAELVLHPWVTEARKRCQKDAFINKIQETLKLRCPDGADADKTHTAWVKLKHVANQAGHDVPVDKAREIIGLAEASSNRAFCVEYRKHDQNGDNRELHEWMVGPPNDEDEDDEGEEHDIAVNPYRDNADGQPAGLSRHFSISSVSSRPISRWAKLKARMRMDRFIITLDDCGPDWSDDESGLPVYWLRVQLLPAMVQRQRRSSILGLFGRRDSASSSMMVESTNFIQLQRWLEQGDEEYGRQQRQELERQRAKQRPPAPAGKPSLLLPGFG
jgi:hypothetical protein